VQLSLRDNEEMRHIMRELLVFLSPEERLAGLSPEERIQGLTPEELTYLLTLLQRMTNPNDSGHPR
jgi:hypothetical protein